MTIHLLLLLLLLLLHHHLRNLQSLRDLHRLRLQLLDPTLHSLSLLLHLRFHLHAALLHALRRLVVPVRRQPIDRRLRLRARELPQRVEPRRAVLQRLLQQIDPLLALQLVQTLLFLLFLRITCSARAHLLHGDLTLRFTDQFRLFSLTLDRVLLQFSLIDQMTR